MENCKKRWSVTYTKHIKQKRKIYQDGFLDHHISTNKVMLFDDCWKLLEYKILKGEEMVSSGETLTFNGYLVDIGGPAGEVVDQNHHKPMIKPSLINEMPKPRLIRRSKFTSPKISSAENKDDEEQGKLLANEITPSKKLLRDFKKSELQKYGALQSCLDTVKSGVTVWQVTYTTQMTKKAKIYYDGFLKLTYSGLSGRQIMLYDTRRELLDSRFLKKDEIIRSHESITFDAHLVDIGEPEAESQLPGGLNIQGYAVKVGKKEMKHEHHYPEANGSTVKAIGKFKNAVHSREDADSTGMCTVDRTKTSNIAATNKSLRDISQILSILQKPIAHESDVMECTNKNLTALVSSAKELTVSDAKVYNPTDCQLPSISLPNDGPSEHKDNRESSECAGIEKCTSRMPSEEICTPRDGQHSCDSAVKISDQSRLDNAKAEVKQCDEAIASNFSSLVSDDKKERIEQLRSERELDEWPTFDLRF